MATLRKEIDAGEELEQLKATVAEQQQRLEILESRQDSSPDSVGTGKEKRATRRQLLKLAGATLMGAAGSAALRAIPASATNGLNVVIGTANTQDLSNTTSLSLTGTAAPGTTFAVNAFNVANQTAVYGGGTRRGVYGFSSNGEGVYGSTFNGIGAYGYAYTTGGIGTRGGGDIGVQGFGYAFYGTQHIGVTGSGSSFGVIGQSNKGVGVKGVTALGYGSAVYGYSGATGAVGVFGASAIGAAFVGFGGPGFVGELIVGDLGIRAVSTLNFPAVQAIAVGGGPDLAGVGTGRLLQVNGVTGGVQAPSFTPSSHTFEMVRGYDGGMWINRAFGAGTLKAAWKRINALRVDAADGSGAAFKPLRLVDTRLGFGGPAGNGTIRDYPAAGAGAGTQHIPSTAVAITGNLTVVAGASGGFMSIHPAGSGYNPATDPATFNFTPHSIVSNAYFSGLGVAALLGQIEVYVGVSGSSPVNFIIDITGYVE